MGDADYLIALELQKEFDKELNSETDFDAKPVEKRYCQKRARTDDEELNNTCNLVHPLWETLDPTPDVQALFQAFDNKFFQGRLRCVCLEWSKRMYSCAGICYTRRNRLGMAVTIRLSEPLLKLRPRKDLIETLLHEMIHAYCSVLGIREGNGGHGPNFRKIMNGINKVAGTNITVYHNFYDEVDTYKTHWWRCNGICQNRKPFLGYVKRTSNRAPGPNDIWWRQHLESCGGTFLKIKEPEKKRITKKDNKEKGSHSGSDLRKFFPPEKKGTTTSTFTGPVKSNGGGTLVINPKGAKTTFSNEQPKTSTPRKTANSFGNLKNVVGLKDIESNKSRNPQNDTPVEAISGAGYSLIKSGNFHNNSNKEGEDSRKVDREKLRDIWAKKQFSSSESQPSNQNSVNVPSNEAKKIRFSSEPESDPEIISDDLESTQENHWKIVDDEIMIKEDSNPIIDISSDEEDNSVDVSTKPSKPKQPQTADERQRQIKQEIIDSSEFELLADDIEIIDDEYDDNLVNLSAELADTSLVDDLFGEDTLLKEFKKENSVFSSNSAYSSDPKHDIISCPVCQDKITREQFSEHIDGCVGITVRVRNPVPSTSKPKIVTPFYKKLPKKKVSSNEIAKTLRNAGYESDELDGIVDRDNIDIEADDRKRRESLYTSTHACPVCAQEVEVDEINEHLDTCLK